MLGNSKIIDTVESGHQFVISNSHIEKTEAIHSQDQDNDYVQLVATTSSSPMLIDYIVVMSVNIDMSSLHE
jgi:hypothetical protein